jgi:WD40 repeat protein/serine/threonine protein kinase
MTGTACPTPDDWAAFDRGDLPDEAAARLAAHLETCPECRALVEKLDPLPERLARGLRPAAPPERFSDEPECQEILDRLREIGPPPGSDVAGTGGTATDTSDPPSALGTIGPYQLVRKVGRGGMGVVYEAVHTRLGKTVAIKILRPDLARGEEAALRRFKREIRAIGGLDHPHIVRATDAGEAGEASFLVMEFVRGLDLSSLVRRHSRLPVADACEIIRQAALGLQHAHEHGLVHRDVKPSNLMLTPEGQVKVLDLGLARLYAGQDGGLTSASRVLGTPDYMAPEQTADSHATDPRADIYSLGCTLYKLLTGRGPFSDPGHGTPVRKLLAHARQPVPSLAGSRPDAPANLDKVLQQMLAKDPAARYPDAASVVAALAPFTAGANPAALLPRPELPEKADDPTTVSWRHAAQVETPRPTPAPAAPRRRLRPVLAVAAVVLLLALLLAALVALSRNRGERTNGAASDPGPVRPPTAAVAPPVVVSPADALKWADVPPELQLHAGGGDPAHAPPEVVAVLADRRLRHGGQIYSVAFTPDGAALATGADDRTIRLWDARTGRARWTAHGLPEEVTCQAFSPDGATLVSASQKEPVLRLWEARTGRPLGTLEGHSEGVFALAFSPDRKTLASAGWDKQVRLWDLAARREQQTFDDSDQDFIRRLVFSPDGRTLVSAGGQLSLWDVATGRLRSTIAHSGLGGICFSPDSRTLVAADYEEGTIALYDAASGAQQAVWQAHQCLLNGIDLSPNGKLLASAGEDGKVRLWEVATRRERVVLAAHTAAAYAVAFSPNGQTLATGGWDGSVKLWDVATGHELLAPQGHAAAVVGLAVSPDGRRLLSTDGGGAALCWDLGSGRLQSASPVTRADLVRFSPDGERLAAARWQTGVRLAGAADGRLYHFLVGRLNGLAFEPSGKSLATVGSEVRIWDVETGKEIRTLPGLAGPALSVAYAPDGRTLAAGGRDRILYLWDLVGGGRRTLKGHSEPVTCVAFHPDGRTLASLGQDDTLRLWDAVSGRVQHIVPFRPGGTTAPLAFRPDGRWLAGGGADGRVHLWDLEPEPPREKTIALAGGGVSSVAFTPEGRHLIAGTADGTVYVLRLATGLE